MLHAFLAVVQDAAATGAPGLGLIGAGLAIGLTVIGAELGIGRIGEGAVQGIARQPEAAGNIQTAGIILAALIEGAALFGLGLVFLLFS